jgi:twinkle protein
VNLDEFERLHEVADQVARAHRLDGKQEARVSQYERELPEFDAIFTCASSDIRERGWQRLQRDENYGSAMPWHKTHRKFRLRPSETTIWAGPNGSWKSGTVNFILGHMAYHGERAFVASLELTADDQLARLSWQMLCNRHPVRSRYDDLMDRLGDNLMIYDFVGQVRPQRAVALARYAAVELQAQHILIDNLTMVVPPGRDADEQAARFVAGLYQVGRDTGAHIHLIAHVRKPEDQNRMLTRYDIRGTGAAPDMVDNVVMMQINEAKRAAQERDSGAMTEEPDLWVTVDKQRHGGYRGRFGFWQYDTTLRLGENGVDLPEAYA